MVRIHIYRPKAAQARRRPHPLRGFVSHFLIYKYPNLKPNIFHQNLFRTYNVNPLDLKLLNLNRIFSDGIYSEHIMLTIWI
jgi:hypothetical protein